ncbi:PREDICTED: olfactory receptor 14I1-like [Galeopterus variegatus]|uniref:Olfactory receptor n=1 Tax=Galeopterus variegatus TaxID=482537 RepID=A0ABM0SCF7_GALVR|nr:PREDICTED: olfactory receptor 14I1-like [Galeopterus variegatus]
MDNLTIITEFLLMNISNSRELQVLQGLLFLVIYLGAVAGNLVTITVIVRDAHLHFPMYFFIGNLSLIDFGYITVTVPKSVVNFLTGSKLISLKECATQTFLYIFFGSSELFILVVMAYDRYVAICHPLHYGITMTSCLCTKLAGGSWTSGLVYSAMHTGTLFRFPFTESNVIHQYFCDVSQIMNISSRTVQFSESVALGVSACIVLLCFVILLTSYAKIFSTVLHMHSVEAQNKALSTCSPQLATFILFSFSGLFAILGPVTNASTIPALLTAMFYSMVPPFVNPIIFSLRNREIKNALGRMFNTSFHLSKRVFVV